MSTFYSKNSTVQDRQLKVQRLCIPFTVTASATSANVVLTSDETSIMFMQTTGNDQITAQDSAAEAAYAGTLSDSSGNFRILLVLGEKALKICRAVITSRTDGTAKACYPDTGGSPAGVAASGNVMLYAPTGVNFTTTSLDACLVVEYQVVGTGN